MRITLNIDDSLPHRAAKLIGLKEKAALVRLGLEALIANSQPVASLNWVAPKRPYRLFGADAGAARDRCRDLSVV